MDRQVFVRQGLTGIITATVYLLTAHQPLFSGGARRFFLEFIEVDTEKIVSAHARSFQMPSGSSYLAQIESLYWVFATGFVLQSDRDIDSVVDGSYRSFLEWYVSDHPSMVLGHPLETSLGDEIVGDGMAAWY